MCTPSPVTPRAARPYLVDDVLFLGDSAQIDVDGEIRPASSLVSDDRPQNRTSLAPVPQRLAQDDARVAALVPAHSGASEGDAPLVAFARQQQ